jgi:MFS family permease
MALAGLLTVLTALGEAEPAVVTAIVFAAGCASALGFPSYQALLPDLVPHQELPAAIALGSAQWNLGRVIGPALAGIVIGLGSYEWAFAVNTLSFLAVVVAIAPLHLPLPSPQRRESIRASVAAGFRFVRGDSGLRAVTVYLALNSLLAAPFIALVPAVALKVFDEEKLGTSVLVTAQGIGAVAMALILGGLAHRVGLRNVVLSALAGLPFALVAYAYAPTLAVAAVCIFFVGMAYLGCLSGFNTVAQLRSPPALRGRVMSVNMMILGTMYPIGCVVQGAVADQVGLRATTAATAVLLGVVVLAVRTLRPGFDRHLDDRLAADALGAEPEYTAELHLDDLHLDRAQEPPTP